MDRGCGRHDARHARDLRGQDGHVRRRDHREFPARHVAADRLHRNVAVAQDHTGECFHFDIAHGRLLRLGEPPDLGLGEADILHVRWAALAMAALDL